MQHLIGSHCNVEMIDVTLQQTEEIHFDCRGSSMLVTADRINLDCHPLLFDVVS